LPELEQKTRKGEAEINTKEKRSRPNRVDLSSNLDRIDPEIIAEAVCQGEFYLNLNQIAAPEQFRELLIELYRASAGNRINVGFANILRAIAVSDKDRLAPFLKNNEIDLNFLSAPSFLALPFEAGAELIGLAALIWPEPSESGRKSEDIFFALEQVIARLGQFEQEKCRKLAELLGLSRFSSRQTLYIQSDKHCLQALGVELIEEVRVLSDLPTKVGALRAGALVPAYQRWLFLIYLLGQSRSSNWTVQQQRTSQKLADALRRSLYSALLLHLTSLRLERGPLPDQLLADLAILNSEVSLLDAQLRKIVESPWLSSSLSEINNLLVIGFESLTNPTDSENGLGQIRGEEATFERKAKNSAGQFGLWSRVVSLRRRRQVRRQLKREAASGPSSRLERRFAYARSRTDPKAKRARFALRLKALKEKSDAEAKEKGDSGA